MPTKTQALVLDAVGADFVLRDIVVDDPLEDEILVKMKTSGICHSDISVQNGTIPVGPAFPCVLGHEGAGTVAKLGKGVTGFAVGDQVLLSFNFCGKCRVCETKQPGSCVAWGGLNFGLMRSDGGLNIGTQSESGDAVRGLFFGQSSFAGYTIASTKSCVKVAKDLDITYLGPLGCGVQTGAGTVLNVLKPTPNDTIAVWGLGGVGISALLAAKSLGVKTIIGVDIIQSRLDLAAELGATHVINGKDADVVEQIAKITGGDMLNYVVEATGAKPCMKLGWDSLGIFGKMAQVGAPKAGTEAPIEVFMGVAMQKTWVGVLEGNSYPPEFIPKLIEMVADGQMPVKKISQLFPIADFQKAIDAMNNGTVMKPILVF
ncbi:hypothetical protein RQP46_004307 [Phenoliferia psychrophenolica]